MKAKSWRPKEKSDSENFAGLWCDYYSRASTSQTISRRLHSTQVGHIKNKKNQEAHNFVLGLYV